MLAAASAAQAEKRIALLIGNQGYTSEIGRLANPHNDIALLETSLKGLGFEVATVRDAGLAALHQAVNGYARRVRAAGPNAVAFFYYSGHGAADAGTNYLIPVDVKSAETGELWDQSLRLTEITRKLKGEAGNATHFVVFDACRNVLKLRMAGSRTLRQSKGFVPVSQEAGMLIAYATAEGELASDLGVGAGPYAKMLAEEMVKPGVEAVVMFRIVQLRVRAAIGQEPWIGFSALGVVHLAGLAPDMPKMPEQSNAEVTALKQQLAKLEDELKRQQQQTGASNATEIVALKEELQERLRLEQMRQDDAAFDSALRLREPAAFKVYLEQYPTGRHRDAAQSQLAELELEARNKAEATAWERARSVNTLLEYQEYLRLWPSGQHAVEAKKSFDRLAELSKRWGSLKEARAPEQLRQLLANARGTEYEATIEARLNDVERADKSDWTKAEAAGSKAAYLAYVAGWTEGDYKDDAKARLAEIDKSAQEWNRIKGKNDEAALEAFLHRAHIADFESAALAELVALKRARDKTLPKGISLLPADAMAGLISGKTIRFVHAGTAISFNHATRPPNNLKLRPSYLQTTTKEKFSLEGAFAADIVLEGRRLSIGGIGGVQESRVDKTGSLLLLQILSTDRTERDIATADRLYATLQIIKDSQGYVCIGTQWSFVLGEKPESFSERCQVD